MSSHHSRSITIAPFQNDLLNRFGGQSQYDMVIISHCNRLKEDRPLRKVFGNFDIDSLVALQKETMEFAFGDFESKEARRTALNRVGLHHFRLVENGLSGEHLARVIDIFAESLRESWVDEDVVQEATELLKNLEIIYGELPDEDTYIPIKQLDGPCSPPAGSPISVTTKKQLNTKDFTRKPIGRTSSAKERVGAMFNSLKPQSLKIRRGKSQG